MTFTAEQRFTGAVAAYLVACLLLGGASAAGAFPNVSLQVLGLFLLWWGGARLVRSSVEPRIYRALILLGLILCLPLIQMVPLPVDWWSALPGRKLVSNAYVQLDVSRPMLGLSLSPYRTFSSWLSLIPASAVYVAMLTVDGDYRNRVGFIVVGAALISLILGFAQFGSAPSQYFYFYDITNVGAAVGFFSNRNHLATLFLIAIPFLGLIFPSAGNTFVSRPAKIGRRVAAIALLAMLCAGILLTGSRAGLALILPTILLTYGSAVRTSKGISPWPVIAGTGAFCALVVAAFLYGPFYERILARSANIEDEARLTVAPIVARTGWENFPFGTGFGTFDPVFRQAAGSANLQPNFVNHAHNDYLELWLTGGLPALLLVLAFLWWFAVTVVPNWRAKGASGGAAARCAGIVITVVLLHSFVDYPLRTAAISSLFAMACAMQFDVCRPKRAVSSARNRPDHEPLELGQPTRLPTRGVASM